MTLLIYGTAFCGATGASLSAQFVAHGRYESGLRQKQTQSEAYSVRNGFSRWSRHFPVHLLQYNQVHERAR